MPEGRRHILRTARRCHRFIKYALPLKPKLMCNFGEVAGVFRVLFFELGWCAPFPVALGRQANVAIFAAEAAFPARILWIHCWV